MAMRLRPQLAQEGGVYLSWDDGDRRGGCRVAPDGVGVNDWVLACGLSPEGRWLALLSDEGVRVVDQERRSFVDHPVPGGVWDAVAVSETEVWIAGPDGAMRLHPEGGAMVPGRGLALSSAGALVRGPDGLVWAREGGQGQVPWAPADPTVAALGNDGTMVLSSGGRVWEGPDVSWTCPSTVTALACAGDSVLAASEGTVWRRTPGALEAVLEVPGRVCGLMGTEAPGGVVAVTDAAEVFVREPDGARWAWCWPEGQAEPHPLPPRP